MRLFRRSSLALAPLLGLVLAGSASAAQTTTRAGEERALAQASSELASRAAQTKGAPSGQYELERRRVDTLIQELQNGQRVSPAAVEDALHDAASPSPW